MREWKIVEGTDGYYEVSNDGLVRSTGKYARVCGGGYRYVKPKMIASNKYPNGYTYVNITLNGERHTALVHRLVAKAFLENPLNLPEINHKDENISNNHVDNLEWCSSKYNANYGTRNKRCREGNRKQFVSIIRIDKSGNRKRYECIGDAKRETGADVSAIIRVCKGKNLTAGGYYWEYARG
jgi:hypothetical protein